MPIIIHYICYTYIIIIYVNFLCILIIQCVYDRSSIILLYYIVEIVLFDYCCF